MAGFNHFPNIAAKLPGVLGQMVRKTAFDVQANAAAAAPVATGFLKSSIYTVTSQGSTYGSAGAPPGRSYLLPEQGPPDDETSAYVAVGANYGIYLEMGTRFMPAQPYFYQAVTDGQASLEAAAATFEAALGGGV